MVLRPTENKHSATINSPSLMRFLRPSVPILSQKLSSLSKFLPEVGVRGDLGLLKVLILVRSCWCCCCCDDDFLTALHLS